MSRSHVNQKLLLPLPATVDILTTATHDCHTSLEFLSSAQKGRPSVGGIPLQLTGFYPKFKNPSGLVLM